MWDEMAIFFVLNKLYPINWIQQNYQLDYLGDIWSNLGDSTPNQFELSQQCLWSVELNPGQRWTVEPRWNLPWGTWVPGVFGLGGEWYNYEIDGTFFFANSDLK